MTTEAFPPFYSSCSVLVFRRVQARICAHSMEAQRCWSDGTSVEMCWRGGKEIIIHLRKKSRYILSSLPVCHDIHCRLVPFSGTLPLIVTFLPHCGHLHSTDAVHSAIFFFCPHCTSPSQLPRL